MDGPDCDDCDNKQMCKRMMILNSDHLIDTHGVFRDHKNELVEGGYGMAKLSNYKYWYGGFETKCWTSLRRRD